jgi:hypothetical protein
MDLILPKLQYPLGIPLAFLLLVAAVLRSHDGPVTVRRRTGGSRLKWSHWQREMWQM